MAEVFRIWGSFELKEEGGPIDRRIDEITEAARDARRPLNLLGDSFDDVSHEALNTNRTFDQLANGLDDVGDAAQDAVRPLREVGDAADDAGSPIDNLKDGFDNLGGVAGGAAAIIGGAFIAALADGVMYSKDLEKQLNDVQRRTQANAKETEDYKESLENLFKEGFSNDIADIGEAHNVAAVQTNLHGKELEEVTKKTMFLSNRLETDYAETIKTVDGMVRDYGITHSEAFDIIAKGYDENLNVGGDLLDLFAEYGPILQQIGIDENDMLSILVSSREKGIFSYDELLDGAKEFQIKMFEMLQDEEAAKEFFDGLGLKASDVKKAFTEGGEAAGKMSGRIMLALSEIEDPVERGKIGVELYGTKWEDTGGKINDVMINSRSRGIETKKAMDNLIETDTDPLAKSWNNFYNTWKADTLEPVGKALSALALDFLDFYSETESSLKDWAAEQEKSMDNFNREANRIFADFMGDVEDIFNDLPGILWSAGQSAGDGFIAIIDWLVDDAINTMNDLKAWVKPVTDAFDALGSGIERAIGKISRIKFPSKPSWIPGFATGVEDFEGGLAMVGERGPELVYLPPKSNVYSNQDTNNMLGNLRDNKSTINNLSTISTSGGNTYNINMNINADSIKSLSNLIDLFENINSDYIAQ